MNQTTPAHPASLHTEEDIASYLISSPDFFERFAEVLGAVQLGNPHGGKAVSLQERQASMLREKIKSLEASIVELMGVAAQNSHTTEKTHDWTCALLRVRDAAHLPEVMAFSLQAYFEVPQVHIRLWSLDAPYAHHPFAQDVAPSAQAYAQNLAQPYCGPRGGVEGLQKIVGDNQVIEAIQSLAILPLRLKAEEGAGTTFGCIVLASPDSHRYTRDMGTQVLARLADQASACLQRMLPTALVHAGHPPVPLGFE